MEQTQKKKEFGGDQIQRLGGGGGWDDENSRLDPDDLADALGGIDSLNGQLTKAIGTAEAKIAQIEDSKKEARNCLGCLD